MKHPQDFITDTLDGVTNIPCGILVMTAHGEILHANRRFLQWIGLSEEELHKAGCFENFLTTASRVYYHVAFAPLLQLHGNADEIAIDLNSVSGERIPCLLSAVQESPPHGVIKLAVFKTPLRRAYESGLIDARKRAEELASQLSVANDGLENFAYVASHDLQEPLRSIIMLCQILQKDPACALSPEAQSILHEVVNTGQRMNSLVENLLFFAKSGASSFDFAEVDCNRVLEHASSNIRKLIQDAGAEIVAPHLPVVKGDELMLIQLFQNLIANAVKYRRPDVKPKVEIFWSIQAEIHQFDVTDNGIGFDPGRAKEIFDPFNRLDQKGNTGTGLGLATCRRIVNRHGGEIWARSTQNLGSAFSFTLPAYPPA